MKVGLAVVLGAFVLSIASAALSSQTAQGSPHLLPPDRARLVAEKERARAAAEVRDLTQAGPFIGPDEPYRSLTRQVVSSRAEFESQWNAWAVAELAAVERQGGPAAAAALRRELQRELDRIRSLPETVVQQIDTIEIGRRSFQVSVFTDNLTGPLTRSTPSSTGRARRGMSSTT